MIPSYTRSRALGFTFISLSSILKSCSGFVLVVGTAMLSLRRSSSGVAYFPQAIWSCNILSVTDTNPRNINSKHCFNIILLSLSSNSSKAVNLSSSTTRSGNGLLPPFKNAVAYSTPLKYS